jgi:NSS family neurotransmitter:Na+ symporter
MGAFRALDKRFAFIGVLGSIVPAIILPYYSVIGGWVMKYSFEFMRGQTNAMAEDAYFGGFISQTFEPLLWFALFIGITSIIVLFGVEKGIEKVSKVMMPVLIVLILFIAIFTICTVDGALDGVIYYIKPDFSKFSVMTVVAAMGQLFYSMSLAMGIMITFGSYMKKDISIERSTKQIEIFDTGIAFLAGLMIIPAVYAFSGGDPEALGKGPSLMFGALPKIFANMPAGTVIGVVFFVMVFLAALTSSISLMETVVSTIQDKFGIKRKMSYLIVLGISMLLGVPSSLGYSAWGEFKILGLQVLDLFDFVSNNILMPIVALATCIFVGYVLRPKTVIDEVELEGNRLKHKKMFNVMIKYVAPVCILIILVSSVLDVFGIVKI